MTIVHIGMVCVIDAVDNPNVPKLLVRGLRLILREDSTVTPVNMASYKVVAKILSPGFGCSTASHLAIC